MLDPRIEIITKSIRTASLDLDFYRSILSIIVEKKSSNNLIGNWHPLGFIIVTLQDWRDDQRLRLHIWPKNLTKRQGNVNWIHNHEYDIISVVLLGTIVNESYRISRQSLSSALPTYNVSHNGHKSNLNLLSLRSDVEVVKRDFIAAGEIYSIEKWDFHLSEIFNGQVTATIVLNENIDRKSPTILGPTDNTAFKYTREQCEGPEFDRSLNELIEHLESLTRLSQSS